MPYTVEYGLKKYVEIMRTNYSGTIAEIIHPSKTNKFCFTGSAIFFYRDDGRVPLIPFKESEE